MKTSVILLSCAVAVTALAGLNVASAMSNRPADGVKPARDRYQCFDSNFIRGFQSVNDHKIVITSDRNEAYELTLGGVCVGLDTSFMIGVRSRHGSTDICGPFDADIVYEDTLGPRRLAQCPIISMRHLQGVDAEPFTDPRRSKIKPNASMSESSQSSW